MLLLGVGDSPEVSVSKRRVVDGWHIFLEMVKWIARKV